MFLNKFFNKKNLTNANDKEVKVGTNFTTEVVQHWINKSPHTIVSSVILKNNKITQWKTGQFSLKDRVNIERLIKLNPEYSYFENKWVSNNDLEHEKIFDVYSKEWFKKWELVENYHGISPFEDECSELLG